MVNVVNTVLQIKYFYFFFHSIQFSLRGTYKKSLHPVNFEYNKLKKYKIKVFSINLPNISQFY